MPEHKKRLRVTKWLGITPAVGICTQCQREFKVSLTTAKRSRDAQENLKMQFDRHICEHKAMTLTDHGQ